MAAAAAAAAGEEEGEEEGRGNPGPPVAAAAAVAAPAAAAAMAGVYRELERFQEALAGERAAWGAERQVCACVLVSDRRAPSPPGRRV